MARSLRSVRRERSEVRHRTAAVSATADVIRGQASRDPGFALIPGLFAHQRGERQCKTRSEYWFARTTCETAQRIKAKVEEAFPCATVEIASTASEVTKKLDDMAHNRIEPYWLVFVDVHLSFDGEEGGPAVYVCDLPFIERLMSDSSESVVFYMSSHLNDPKVVEFRQRCDKLSRARPIFIEKDIKGAWIGEILRWMRSTVHSRRIRAMLKETFGARRALQVQSSNLAFAGASAGRNGPVSGDATQMLSGLSRDISKHWVYLDDDAKRHVRDYFKVVEEGDRPRVSLL